MNREYHKWFSPQLQREMELLVFGHAGARVIVFPARMGRFYEYENWGLVNALREKIVQGWIQLYCVDSVDTESLYNFDASPQERMDRHIAYEQYVLKEVLPFTETKNTNPFVIVHGCSLGAYHAVNIAFRHPGKFGKVVALSGRYDLASPVAEFYSLFGDYYNETIYYHTPSHFIPAMSSKRILAQLRRMEIILVCGREDPFLENNRQLSMAMWAKNIRHGFYVWEGRAHNAYHWRKMVPWYL